MPIYTRATKSLPVRRFVAQLIAQINPTCVQDYVSFLCRCLSILFESSSHYKTLVSKNSQRPPKVWEPSSGRLASMGSGSVLVLCE